MRVRLMRWLLLMLLPATISSSTLELVVPARTIRHISLTPRGVVSYGLASYYGSQFDGRIARDGSVYRHEGMTAASNSISLGTSLRVCREDRPWRCVDVTITDTGQLYGRLLDLSRGAARRLGMMTQGVVNVTTHKEE